MKILLLFVGTTTIMLWGCRKAKNYSAPQTYVSNMGGVRGWVGTESDTSYIFPHNVTHSSFSEKFALIVVDDSIIVCNDPGSFISEFDASSGRINDTFNYYSDDASFKTITFVKTVLINNSSIIYDTIIYNYANNNISYSEYWFGPAKSRRLHT